MGKDCTAWGLTSLQDLGTCSVGLQVAPPPRKMATRGPVPTPQVRREHQRHWHGKSRG